MPDTQNTISVVATAYNDPQNAPGLYSSLARQTIALHEVITVDNSDNTPVGDIVKEHYPTATVLSHPENLDFSAGSNTGIAHATGEYVLLLNSDMSLEPNCVEKLVTYMDKHLEVGAASPLLLREGEGTIDSLGIAGDSKRRFTNIGEGARYDAEELSTQQDFFGISGTAVLFRRSTLEALVKNGGGHEHEYFDEDFIAYKDDIDLSYRLHHLGIGIARVDSAIAYHNRTAQEKAAQKGMISARSDKSNRINRYSLRNHWWVLLKNEPFSNLLLHSPQILFYECQKLIFVLLFERRTLGILPSFFRGLPSILRKRKAILNSSTLTAKEIRNFFR